MNETFYALVENGVVTNVMVLYPPNAAEFEGAVPCGDLPVAVGDTYDGEHFYRGGEKLDSPLAVAQQEAQTLKEDIPMLKAQIQGHQRPKRFCGGLYRRNGDGGVCG